MDASRHPKRSPRRRAAAALAAAVAVGACVAVLAGDGQGTTLPRFVVAAASAPDATRALKGAVGERSVISLEVAANVRRVSLFVDDDALTTPVLRRLRGPFALGRGSKAGLAALTPGPHAVAALVEYRDGSEETVRASYSVRRRYLSPTGSDGSSCSEASPCRSLARGYRAAGPGEVVEAAPGAYACSAIRGDRPGPVVIRGAAVGQAVVECDLPVSASRLRLERLAVSGRVTFLPGADGSSFAYGSATAFSIFGADDVTVSDSTFDGGSETSNNQIWDEPAGDTPDRFRVAHNVIRNFFGPDADSHSEGLYVGYSTGGLIEANRFEANGNTAHVFFTWFGATADPELSYPRDICVRRNRFGATRGAFTAVAFRSEIPSGAGIVVDRTNSTVGRLALSSRPVSAAGC